jgi:hypothetical protein
MINLPFIFNALFVYTGNPFKVKIYENWVLTIIIVLNAIAAIAFFFINPFMKKSFGLTPISTGNGGKVLAIMMSSMIMAYIINRWLANRIIH